MISHVVRQTGLVVPMEPRKPSIRVDSVATRYRETDLRVNQGYIFASWDRRVRRIGTSLWRFCYIEWRHIIGLSRFMRHSVRVYCRG